MKGKLYEKFNEIMIDEEKREDFHRFLLKNLCDEHYDFYIDALAYENMTSSKRRRRAAKRIFNTFLSPDASNPVNIPSDVHDKVTQDFEDGEFTETMFDDCKMAVCKLLALDCLPRYLTKLKKMKKKSTKRMGAKSVENEEKEEKGDRVGRSPKRSKKSGKSRGKSTDGESRLKGSGRKIRSAKSVDSIRKKKLDEISEEQKKKKKRSKKRGKSGEKSRTKNKISTNQRKSKSLEYIKKSNKKKKNQAPLQFDDAYENEDIRNNFYEYLVKSFANEYLDFYVDVLTFQNTDFDDDDDKRKAIDDICLKYLGIGEGAVYLISVNFEVMDDFKERLEKEIKLDIFSLILSEAKTILKSQYQNYISMVN